MTRTLQELAAAFADRTLPKAEWTHEAHLRVGLWHVLEHGEDEALRLLRERITLLNETHGVVNDDHGGYHETITRFYAWRIARFVEARGSAGPEGVDALEARLLAECGAKDLALGWWSRHRLMSVEARRGWLEPDLRPLSREAEGDDVRDEHAS